MIQLPGVAGVPEMPWISRNLGAENQTHLLTPSHLGVSPEGLLFLR